jgi:hypothetical protein
MQTQADELTEHFLEVVQVFDAPLAVVEMAGLVPMDGDAEEGRVKAGDLPSYRLGCKLVIPADALAEFLEKRRV